MSTFTNKVDPSTLYGAFWMSMRAVARNRCRSTASYFLHASLNTREHSYFWGDRCRTKMATDPSWQNTLFCALHTASVQWRTYLRRRGEIKLPERLNRFVKKYNILFPIFWFLFTYIFVYPITEPLMFLSGFLRLYQAISLHCSTFSNSLLQPAENDFTTSTFIFPPCTLRPMRRVGTHCISVYPKVLLRCVGYVIYDLDEAVVQYLEKKFIGSYEQGDAEKLLSPFFFQPRRPFCADSLFRVA
jgi:hypothetical protein